MSSETAYFPDALARISDPRNGSPDRSEASPNSITAATTSVDATDEQILEGVREGSREELAVLFRRYAQLVRSVALRILRDTAEADDLVQEVFLFIYQKCSLFDRTRGSARSWIVQVTYHRAIDRRRKLASRQFYNGVELDEALLLFGENDTQFAEYERTIEGALGRDMPGKIREALSADQRRTLELYFIEGHTFDEIASITGHAIGNVRNHYYRALEKIRELVFPRKLRAK